MEKLSPRSPSMSPGDRFWMLRALELAKRVQRTTIYAVGCVIVSAEGEELASGYTGEQQYQDEGPSSFPHAEEVALSKLTPETLRRAAALYTSLEPCSQRASGRRCCADRIRESGVRRVVYAAREPFDDRLGIRCCGAEQLTSAGVECVQYQELEAEALRIARANR
jgi:pyrimidine deaminase RibD-like protein